jgi:hypothetical protein
MSFEDWWYEQEGFGLRAERFFEEECERDMQLFINMKKWLEAAYEAGNVTMVDANFKIGAWLSAALEDPSTCQSMKDDINEWFKCTPKMEARKREWVYLTEEEMLDIVDTYGMPLADAIEAKLKEKNNCTL